jgi:ubiquinone/menaquinone biosynthesis C-methylase UbiE
MYMSFREKEMRVYNDDEVSHLPFIHSSHTHYKEWKIRSRSALRLCNYLESKNKPLSVLEVGCGNGWLSARLAELMNSTVTGIDINTSELTQAQRVFGDKANLHFAEGGLESLLYDIRFDVIIFAASIQYFHFFDDVIRNAFLHLKPMGEIHIIDSHFYQDRDLEPAKQRTQLYYESIRCSEMAGFYFHHSFESLKSFQYKLLFNPLSIRRKLFASNNPFPWICISSE